MSNCFLMELRFILSQYCFSRRLWFHDCLQSMKSMVLWRSYQMRKSYKLAIINFWEDKHLTCNVLMDRAATSRALSNGVKPYARQQVSERHFKNGFSYPMFPSVFGGIVENSHYFGILIGYIFLSLFVLVDGTYCFLSPLALSFIRDLWNATFHQNNARLHIAGIIPVFLNTENYPLLLWAVHSSDLSPLQYAGSTFAERMARHYASVTTVHELWQLVEVTVLPVCIIQFLYA